MNILPNSKKEVWKIPLPGFPAGAEFLYKPDPEWPDHRFFSYSQEKQLYYLHKEIQGNLHFPFIRILKTDAFPFYLKCGSTCTELNLFVLDSEDELVSFQFTAFDLRSMIKSSYGNDSSLSNIDVVPYTHKNLKLFVSKTKKKDFESLFTGQNNPSVLSRELNAAVYFTNHSKKTFFFAGKSTIVPVSITFLEHVLRRIL